MEINEKELEKIFLELKQGNKENFEEFYKKYNKLVYKIAFSILKNRENSEDVVQDVFKKIYLLESNKLPDKGYISWIYSVTKNQSLMALRKNKNNIDLDLIYEIEDENNEIENLIDKEKYNKLISNLNEKEREIVSLKVLANMPFKDISKVLNEPVGTVKWRYYKSINNLKILIANLGMFILTFIIGIKSINKNKNLENNLVIQNDENTINQNNSNNEDFTNTNKIILPDENSAYDETNLEDKDLRSSDENSLSTENQLNNRTEQNIIQNFVDNSSVAEEVQNVTQTAEHQEKSNCFGIVMIIISAVFFLIFLKFLIKNQLKSKDKSSK